MQVLIKNITSTEDACFWEGAGASDRKMEKPHYISVERWEKIKTLKGAADRKRSLTAGYLLHLMCRELHIENPSYGYSNKGKPYLIGHGDISYNISHSGDYAVLAYQESKEPVGIDIQQIRPLRGNIKKRILHEAEELPGQLSKEEEMVYLNRIWSIKESYVKMLGDGLAYDFRNIYIDFENRRIMTENRESAFFAEADQLSGYALAACMIKESELQIIEC